MPSMVSVSLVVAFLVVCLVIASKGQSRVQYEMNKTPDSNMEKLIELDNNSKWFFAITVVCTIFLTIADIYIIVIAISALVS